MKRDALKRSGPGTKRPWPKYEAAVADYDEALRLKPDFADAYFNRGLAKERSGPV